MMDTGMSAGAAREGGSKWTSRLARGIRHAFAVEKEDAVLDEADQALLERTAQAIARRGLAAPAVMLLESAQPFHSLGGQALAFFEPLLSAVFDPAQCERVRKLLERRAVIPALIERIEAQQADSAREASGR